MVIRVAFLAMEMPEMPGLEINVRVRVDIAETRKTCGHSAQDCQCDLPDSDSYTLSGIGSEHPTRNRVRFMQ